jgi:putative lipoic acid-binding regulatory protein
MDPDIGSEYPYLYSLRVIGHARDDFEPTIHGILRKHGTQAMGAEEATRHSRKGNYMSLTIRFMIESRSQLEAIYMDLKDSEYVLMVL